MPFSGHNLMLILGSLTNGELTAVKIIEQVRKTTGVRIPITSIYTQLERLEADSLIRGHYRIEEATTRRGRPRKYYALTTKGNRTLSTIDRVRGVAPHRRPT